MSRTRRRAGYINAHLEGWNPPWNTGNPDAKPVRWNERRVRDGRAIRTYDDDWYIADKRHADDVRRKAADDQLHDAQEA